MRVVRDGDVNDVSAREIHWVRFLQVPVRDYLRLHAHHDAVLREMALLRIQTQMGDAVGSDVRDLLTRLDDVRPAVTLLRTLLGERVQTAADDGLDRVSVDLPVEPAMADQIESLLELFDDIDAVSAADRMLTPPTPLDLRPLRWWLRSELTAQVRTASAPSLPPGEHLPATAAAATATEPPDVMAGAELEALPPVDARLDESETRYRRLIESVNAVIWEADAATFQCTFATPSAERLFGYPAEHWTARAGFFFDLVHPGDRETVDERMRQIAATGGRHAIDYRVITAEGRTRWIRDTVELVVGGGASGRLVGLMVDVTDERELSRRRLALYEAARALADAKTVAEGAPRVLRALAEGFEWDLAQLGVTDRDTGVVRWAASWSDPGSAPHGFERMRELSVSEGQGFLGRVWASQTPAWIDELAEDDDYPRLAAARAYGLHAGVCFPVTIGDQVVALIEVYAKERRPRDDDMLAEMSAFAAQLGQFIERRRAEEEQRFQRALLESQAEASIDGIVVVSDDGRVLFHNQRYVELSRIDAALLDAGDAQAVLDWSISQLADPVPFLANLERLRTSHDQAVHQELLLRDGRILDSHTAQLLGPSGQYYGRAWFIRDVTERRKSEVQVRQLAATLQASLLPPHDPEIPGLEVGSAYVGATSGIDVGGDVYDVFPTSSGWGVVMGDVCGKGAEAARLTGLIRYTARGAAMAARSPSDVLRLINATVLRDGDAQLCTVVYAHLATGDRRVSVTVATGGHPLPIVVRAGGEVSTVGQPGTLLGAFDQVALTDTNVELGAGDTFVLYTDGVTEARRGSEFFGSAALVELLRKGTGLDAAGVVALVRDTVLAFQAGDPRDDIALLAVRVPPA